MRIWRGLETEAKNFQGGVVTIGNFDGLHLGHQALFQAVAARPGPRVAVTFEPHPVQVLYPERGLRRLFPPEDLDGQLPRFGIDLLVRIPFTPEFARQPADLFLDQMIMHQFRPSHLVVGYDFALGRDRTGDLPWLRQWCLARSVSLTEVAQVNLRGQPVSSRGLRDLISAGDVEAAAEMLGRPFYLRGQVVPGAGRGRGIGVPTVNLKVVNETWPAAGVYVSRVRFDGRTRPSVTNIGRAPTFVDAGEIRAETHILDFSGDLYGQILDVEFLKRLRGERRFSGPEDLKKQIEQDILEARREHGQK